MQVYEDKIVNIGRCRIRPEAVENQDNILRIYLDGILANYKVSSSFTKLPDKCQWMVKFYEVKAKGVKIFLELHL